MLVFVVVLGTFIILWFRLHKSLVGNSWKIQATQQWCNWQSKISAKFLWWLIYSRPLDNDVIKIQVEVGNSLVGLVCLTCDGVVITWSLKSTIRTPAPIVSLGLGVKIEVCPVIRFPVIWFDDLTSCWTLCNHTGWCTVDCRHVVFLDSIRRYSGIPRGPSHDSICQYLGMGVGLWYFYGCSWCLGASLRVGLWYFCGWSWP